MARRPDLPGSYARAARNIAFTALLLDGLAVVSMLMVPQLGMNGFLVGFALASLGAIVSIAGLVASARCAKPRPVGSLGTLLIALAIIGWVFYVGHQLAGLANVH